MATIDRAKSEKVNVVLDIAVKNVGQLFDMRDPAPFRERDLDDDLVEYIVSRMQDFPRNAGLSLRFVVSEEALDPKHQSAVGDAVRSYFDYEAGVLNSKLKENFRMARNILAMGLATLVICLLIAEVIGANFESLAIGRIAQEGFTITGWVAMWRPIEVFLYGWWPIREDQRMYMRLAQASVEVQCSTPAPI